MRKVKIYPTKKQKELFERCLGTHRYFYNKAIAYNAAHKEVTSFFDLRDKVLPRHRDLNPDSPEHWITKMPRHTCELAIKDFAANLKACKTNLRKQNIKKFRIEYLTKKAVGIFWLRSNTVNRKNGNLYVMPKRLGADSRLKLSRKGKNTVKSMKGKMSDTIIQKDKTGYYILLYVTIPNKHKNEPIKKDIIALDPGVRTFLTGYSNQEIIEYGNNLPARLQKKFDRVDKLKTICDLPNTRKKLAKKLEKRRSLLKTKARNIIADFQWKAAKHLTNNYSCILLPEFNTSKMVRRDAGLPKPVRKAMLALSHYKFKQKIEWLSGNKASCKVIYCGEEYTSKTCTNCGILNENLGANKSFICGSCNCKLDRDWNGARNIYIKNVASYFGKK